MGADKYSAMGMWEANLVRSGLILLQKNEFLFSGDLAEAPALEWGSCSLLWWLLSWYNMSSFGQHASRKMWKHLLEPRGSEQEQWGWGSCFQWKRMNFFWGEGRWSLPWRGLRESTEQCPVLQQEGEGNQFQWKLSSICEKIYRGKDR